MKNENLENAVESTEIIVEGASNKSNITKLAIGAGVIGLVVVGILYLNKRRKSKKNEIVVCEEAVEEVVEDKKSSKK